MKNEILSGSRASDEDDFKFLDESEPCTQCQIWIAGACLGLSLLCGALWLASLLMWA